MWSWIAWPVVAFVGLLHGPAPRTAYERMVDRVSESVVRIQSITPDGRPTSCSGIAMGVARVLTAAHCIADPQAVRADGLHVVEVIRINEYYDLAWLNVPMMLKEPLKIREAAIRRFEPLTAIGYAYGWSKLSVRPQVPFLLHTFEDQPSLSSAPGWFMQGGFAGGMSGGPIVDAHGYLVSIVQRGADNVGYGVSAAHMLAFLEGLSPAPQTVH